MDLNRFDGPLPVLGGLTVTTGSEDWGFYFLIPGYCFNLPSRVYSGGSETVVQVLKRLWWDSKLLSHLLSV